MLGAQGGGVGDCSLGIVPLERTVGPWSLGLLYGLLAGNKGVFSDIHSHNTTLAEAQSNAADHLSLKP